MEMSDIQGQATYDQGGPPGEKKISEIGRVFGVLFSPIKTFQDIGRKPTWLVPLIVVIALTLISQAMVMPRYDFERELDVRMEKAKEKGIQVDEKTRDMQLAVMKKAGPVMGIVGPLIGIPVVYLVLALIYFAVIRLSGGALGYVGSFSVVCFTGIPGGIKGLITGFAALGRESVIGSEVQSLVPSNPGFFLSAEKLGPFAHTLMQFLDVFGIWGLALTAIGLASVSSWTRGKSATLAIIVYVLMALLLSGLAGLGAMFGG
jgi:hypothetical protein